jgi:hypothetical protein
MKLTPKPVALHSPLTNFAADHNSKAQLHCGGGFIWF